MNSTANTSPLAKGRFVWLSSLRAFGVAQVVGDVTSGTVDAAGFRAMHDGPPIVSGLIASGALGEGTLTFDDCEQIAGQWEAGLPLS
ncbi:MAG: hypothetical protein LBG97_02900 [Coriobacteriales bacterium]|nr:hypothetical protein [Coriobacteriales bacterium]